MTMQLPVPIEHGDVSLHNMIDDARRTMEGEMEVVRERARTYLNWYSPIFDLRLKRHDAWEEPIDWNDDVGTSRNNFPICRAVVDIWTSLEAAKQPIPRAEPELVPPPLPSLDQAEAMLMREEYAQAREIEGMRAEMRGRRLRDWLRADSFALKHHRAVKRKNLYGMSWTKVLPNTRMKRPTTHVMRDPTTVYPIWSNRDPDELEAVLNVQKESAVRANEKYKLGMNINADGRVIFEHGYDYGNYREVNDRHYDSSRTMVWVEDFWWIEREWGDGGQQPHTDTKVHNVVRVLGKVVHSDSYDWNDLPFVYWENTDERDSYGWSDVANVIDINDEFNRRMSEEGDILAMYSQPRFQLLGAIGEREVEMPGPLELLALQDTERIEQILTRIDVYPAQQHMMQLTDLLHRVSGLPPIVWGMIANAQTSGRALTASWKATETRLVPKLMRNRMSLDRLTRMFIDYGRLYDWHGSKILFENNYGETYDDIRWTFPPMEPRDFQEVTMDAITRRDAGLTTTVEAMRDTGDEKAEETEEAVLAEFQNIFHHPDKVQAFMLAQRAQMDNMQFAQQLQAQQQQGGAQQAPTNTATVGQAVGQARQAQNAAPQAAPPGAEGAQVPSSAGNGGAPGGAAPGGAPGGDDSSLTSGVLFRNGEVSNQHLETRQL